MLTIGLVATILRSDLENWELYSDLWT